jgi:hypothetical protein
MTVLFEEVCAPPTDPEIGRRANPFEVEGRRRSLGAVPSADHLTRCHSASQQARDGPRPVAWRPRLCTVDWKSRGSLEPFAARPACAARRRRAATVARRHGHRLVRSTTRFVYLAYGEIRARGVRCRSRNLNDARCRTSTNLMQFATSGTATGPCTTTSSGRIGNSVNGACKLSQQKS